MALGDSDYSFTTPHTPQAYHRQPPTKIHVSLHALLYTDYHYLTIALRNGCPAQDQYGLLVSHVIERLSGQCVYGTQASLSWYFGYMSLICWFQAQFPQLIMNLQRSSTDGVSPGFLANWMTGDVTNLLGCILTKQLPFQTLLATYYCFIDSCLVCQYLFYNVVRRPSVVVLEGVEQQNSAAAPTRTKSNANLNSVIVVATLMSGVSAQGPLDEDSRIRTIGLISAWASSLLYFTSRLPQIYTNYTRKSTEGLSVLLFVAAFMGNLFYTLSIVTSPLAWPSKSQNEEDASAFLQGALPFLIGSAGTLCFDVAIVTQWAYYRPARPLFNIQFSFERVRRSTREDRSEAATLLPRLEEGYGSTAESLGPNTNQRCEHAIPPTI